MSGHNFPAPWAVTSGVAACVLDAMGDDEAAEALGVDVDDVKAAVRRLASSYHARNRVALALALQREVEGKQWAA